MTAGATRLVGAAWLQRRHRVFAAEYDAMVQDARLPRGGAVLDAGCGAGTHLTPLRRAVGPDGSVTGCDLDPANIVAARTARDDDGDGYARLDCCAVTALPYPDTSFDAVWCANVLQYLDDAAALAALHELLRVLRPGGALAVKDVDMLIWRIHPGDPLLIARLVEAQSRHGAVPSIRARLLRRMLEVAGAVDVVQRTLVLERWAPLSDDEAAMYSQWLAELAEIAAASPVGPADRAAWQGLVASRSADHPVRAPDFYACEGQVLATGLRA